MGLIEKCLPKTDNFFYRVQTGPGGSGILAGSGVISFAVFSLVDIIRRIGSHSFTGWLVSLFLVIPYYVFF